MHYDLQALSREIAMLRSHHPPRAGQPRELQHPSQALQHDDPGSVIITSVNTCDGPDDPDTFTFVVVHEGQPENHGEGTITKAYGRPFNFSYRWL